MSAMTMRSSIRVKPDAPRRPRATANDETRARIRAPPEPLDGDGRTPSLSLLHMLDVRRTAAPCRWVTIRCTSSRPVPWLSTWSTRRTRSTRPMSSHPACRSTDRLPQSVEFDDRVTRDATEEFQFPAARIVRNSDALYQRVQVGRVTLAPRLDVNRSDQSVVDGFLVLVDRSPHLAQRPPQLRFALPLHRDLRQRHHGRGEDQQDRRDDKQLDEREAGLATQTAKPRAALVASAFRRKYARCQGAKVPGCKGARVLECEGADARTGNGATPGQVIVSPLVLIVPPRSAYSTRRGHCNQLPLRTPAGGSYELRGVPSPAYLTVTVTGLNCNGAGAPSGVLATPLT